jgi:hypothetical protein
MENQVHDDALEQKTISRRQLLKTLIAAGGAVTASTLLPGEWARPVVEVGVLPAHAQASAISTATPTPTVAPTPIPYAIIGCYAYNAAGGGIISPTDTIQAFAEIAPTTAGVQLRRTITLHEITHPQDGVVDTVTGPTDALGVFQPPDFDLNILSPAISSGNDKLTVLWEFVNPTDGTNTCENLIDVV